jgi:glycerol kinase
MSQVMMQIQSDVLTISVPRLEMTEVTTLRAAIAARIRSSIWESLEQMGAAFGTDWRGA